MLLIQPDADLETGWSGLWTWPEGFLTASGRAVRETDETVWMFDNEIDWVKRIESVLARVSRREAPGFWALISLNVALIQGRAQAMSYCKLITQAKCSSKKSVFRSDGDCMRKRARPCSEAEN